MPYTIHKCEEEGCRGEQYKGLYFECHQCGTRAFIDCIEYDMRYFLYNVIDILPFKSCTDYDGDTYFKRNMEKIRGTFHHLIKFICHTCNRNTKSTEDLQRKIDSLEKELSDVRIEYSDSSPPDVNKVTDIETEIASLLTSVERANESIQIMYNWMQTELNMKQSNLKGIDTDLEDRRGNTSMKSQVMRECAFLRSETHLKCQFQEN